MPQFLVAIQHPENYELPLDAASMMRDIGALNREMIAAGVRDFAGGLQSASRAKSVRKQPGGELVVSDGPYLEAKEHVGGLWLLKCAGMDEAVEWARKAAVACRVPVEVREFLAMPAGSKLQPEGLSRKPRHDSSCHPERTAPQTPLTVAFGEGWNAALRRAFVART